MRFSALFPMVLLAAAPSIAQTTIAPTPSDGESTVTITFTSPLVAAGTGLLYSNANATAGTACVASPTDLVGLKAGVPTTADANSKSLVLVTDKPLAQGTPVCAVVSGAGIPAGAVSAPVVLVGAAATPPGFDWGRVRAYFAAGALTSQDRGQFSHQDLFLAFQLDKVYIMSGAKKDGTFRPRLSTFYEARLTALPVAVQSCSSSASTCASSSTSTTTGSSSNPATTSQTFLNSQKSALLQFGIYHPIYFRSWSVSSQSKGANTATPYALFIAPLVKTGFDTTLNGLNETQQQASTPSSVQAVGNSSQFYKFYDFGFRLGHDQLSTKDSQAPDRISYLDVGWGRYSNLASLLCPANEYLGNNSCNAPAGSLPWHRDIRLRVEGLLEVPATKGFSVGFSTNVSFHPGAQSNTSSTVHIQPADDLRFLFAYKFDITKIATKLAPQNF
jgi:hypothetical protein